jgi:Recombination directionality factor-like
MPVIGIQQQQTEVGRIRLGVKVGTGKGRPTKLDRLRFTSPRRVLVDTIAHLYGGTVEAWQPPKGNAQWQVITNTTEVPVLIPPQDPADSQWYEMWSAGGCQRRCDGQTERLTKQPCLCLAQGCPPEKRDCKLHTRLRVMLEDVPGLGCWRVDTGSYYAAVELPGVAALLAMAQGAIPGKLVLDQRTVTRQVDGKPQTFNFAVPTLHVDEITPRQLMSGRVQELVAANRAQSIDAGLKRAAIGSAVDYPSLVDAARTLDALRDLFTQAGKDNALTDELRGLLEEKAQEIQAAEHAGEPEEAELMDHDELWPATATPAGEPS